MSIVIGRPFAIGRAPWKTLDPFLFCVFHDDQFPKAGSESTLGPDPALLRGRELTMDFSYTDGWSMYHGTELPGFPQHPHRGFETVTCVLQGLVDHFDSLGATGRYGNGDVQWMTAGDGIQHSEMFPLVNHTKANPLELFQIWLNLPARKKTCKPYFEMLWKPQVPRRPVGDSEVIVVAGDGLVGVAPPKTPPDSWAADPTNEVAIWVLNGTKPGGTTIIPAAKHGADINRTLYFFRGDAKALSVKTTGGTQDAPAVSIQKGTAVQLDASKAAEISWSANGTADVLILQGRPIREPVVQRGPFVVNSEADLTATYQLYSKTRFGGWPWPSADHHHPKAQKRFARRPGSDKDEYPPQD